MQPMLTVGAAQICESTCVEFADCEHSGGHESQTHEMRKILKEK